VGKVAFKRKSELRDFGQNISVYFNQQHHSDDIDFAGRPKGTICDATPYSSIRRLTAHPSVIYQNSFVNALLPHIHGYTGKYERAIRPLSALEFCQGVFHQYSCAWPCRPLDRCLLLAEIEFSPRAPSSMPPPSPPPGLSLLPPKVHLAQYNCPCKVWSPRGK